MKKISSINPLTVSKSQSIIVSFIFVALVFGVCFFLYVPSSSDNRVVHLYYYQSEKDVDAEGNIQCSEAGMEAVERSIHSTDTPIEDTLQLLLRGELTEEEKSRGISTEYPLPGLELVSTELNEGTLSLGFEDPQNKTGGGSCRVAILWLQIEATAEQFSEVQEVRFEPEWLFQP